MIEDLKIYGISLSALGGSIISEINPILSTLVLSATLFYTVLQIIEKFKDKNNE